MKNNKIWAALFAFSVCLSSTAQVYAYGYDLGDVDNNTVIDSSDASLVLTEYSALSTTGVSVLSDKQRTAADVNKDGKIDAADASDILSYYSYISTGGKKSIEYYAEDYAPAVTSETNIQTTVTTTATAETTTAVRVQEIQLSKYELNMEKGETESVYCAVFPSSSENKELVWKSTNSSIAYADSDGLIYAVGEGNAVIVVKSADNPEVTASINIKVSSPVTTTSAPPETTTVTTTTTVSQQEMLNNMANEMACLVNETRAQYGLAPLKVSPYLSELASIRANECAYNFTHTRPDGSDFESIVDENIAHYWYIGENIAAGSSDVETTFLQWKNSTKHWAEILNSESTHIGIGVCYVPDSQYKWYWSQIFMNPSKGYMDGEYVPAR